MKKEVVKMGVIGLGRGHEVMSLAINEPTIKIRAICDKNPEKLEAAKAFYAKENMLDDILCFDNAEDFMNSDIDAVYIATDAIYHVPYVKMAMEAGKHVISEIPAVNSIEEAKELKAIVKAHPELKYMCGENCCYWAFIQGWKRMRDEGRLGDVVFAEAEYLHATSPKLFKPLDANHWRTFNPAIHYLTHELGPLLYIMDDRCVSVSCIEPDVKYDPNKNGPENAVAIFKTAKGAAIKIFIGFGAYVGFDHNYSIYGTRGTLETERGKVLKEKHTFARLYELDGLTKQKVEMPVTIGFPGADINKGHGGADLMMMKAFVQCIIDDTEPPIDVDFGIQMTIPGLIAHKSAEMGGAVLEIPEI